MSSALIVQNQIATGPEYRVAQALIKYEIPFRFQVDIAGGRLLRGGFVVDFEIYNPQKMPLEVFGDYWHRAQFTSRDRLKVAMLAQIYGYEPIIIWENECKTQADANRAVREKVL